MNYNIKIKEFSHIKAVYTTHIGLYNKSINACNAINKYISDNTIKTYLPYREIYIK